MPYRPHRWPAQTQPGLQYQLRHRLSDLGHVIFSLSGFPQSYLWTEITHSLGRLWWSQDQLHGHATCSWTGVLGSEGPSVWFNAFLLYMEICNNFVFELVFCKWTLMGQWSVHVSRWDMYMWYVYLPFLLPLCIVFAIPHEHRIPVVMEFHDAWEFREPQSEYKICMLHLRLNKWVLRGHFPFKPEHLLWMQK